MIDKKLQHIPEAPVILRPITSMAYTITRNPSNPNTYRVERGFPFQRAGQTVPPVPQFRALPIYASTTQASGLKSFTSSTTKVTVKYPTAAK